MPEIFNIDDFDAETRDKTFNEVLTVLYGDGYKEGEDTLRIQRERYLRLSGLFKEMYPGHGSFRIFSAPGRIEIAGNHTDHQGGRVICASVDIDVIAFAAGNDDNVIRIKSEGHSGFDVIDLNVHGPAENEKGTSAALIRGVVAGFRLKGFKVGGFDAYTTSNIPKGSGLSSSAAFEILVAAILNHMYNGSSVPLLEMAKASQYSENVYFGKPSGLMDQCGCAFGGIMTIDFKDRDNAVVRPLDIDFSGSGYFPVITDTRGDHSDLTGEYTSITEDMKKTAGFFGSSLLSQVDPDVFLARIPEAVAAVGTGPVLRAMHFFADNDRVLKQAEALEASDFSRFLDLINESGISSWTLLRNIYPVSHPERQQVALGLAVSRDQLGGNGACRVHGGGFAGTIQAFVPAGMISGYIKRMEELFGPGSSKIVRIRNMPASEPFAV